MAARLFGTIVFLLSASTTLAIDPGRVAVGDKLYVAVDGAELQVRGKRDSRLARKTEIRVLEVRDPWVGGSVVIKGKEKKGWVLLRKVFKPDDARDLAALKSKPFRMDMDFSGNVLEIAAARSSIAVNDLAGLKGLYSLESLDLSGTTIEDDDLNPLRRLTNLRRLYLEKTSISDRGLDAVASLPRLEVLALGQTRVTGPGLARLEKLKDLQVLNVSGCRIGDDDLRFLARFESLRVLALHATLLNGAGLGHLRGLSSLNLLNLNGCKLTARAILSLNGLDALRALYLDRSAIDDNTERQLNRLLPRLAVIKGGAP